MTVKYFISLLPGIFVSCLAVLLLFTSLPAEESSVTRQKILTIADSSSLEELGEALFSDVRFSSPQGRVSGLKKDKFSQFRISCRSCHLVNEKLNSPGSLKGMRGYTDFSSRSPVPYRDGDREPLQFTHRRTQQLINAAGKGFGSFSSYHSDGEFTGKSEHENLIKLINSTFVSRNMGWRPGEEKFAASLRLRFILEDNFPAGSKDKENPSYIEQFCMAYGLERREFLQLDGDKILELSAEAVAYYIEQIRSDIDSPFDRFIVANDIADPKIADENTLRSLLKKKSYVFIDTVVPVESEIISNRKIKFGKNELEGLRIFMDSQKANCVSCHTPPEFTDKRFHNIGVSEFDYKDVHGSFPGNFYKSENLMKDINSLAIIELKTKYQVYPRVNSIESIDLGHALFTSKPEENFGAFRTPALRNLKYCDPYLHSGRAGSIKNAVEFHYLSASFRSQLLYISKELPEVKLTPRELDLLVMFLKSLNDHYE